MIHRMPTRPGGSARDRLSAGRRPALRGARAGSVAGPVSPFSEWTPYRRLHPPAAGTDAGRRGSARPLTGGDSGIDRGRKYARPPVTSVQQKEAPCLATVTIAADQGENVPCHSDALHDSRKNRAPPQETSSGTRKAWASLVKNAGRARKPGASFEPRPNARRTTSASASRQARRTGKAYASLTGPGRPDRGRHRPIDDRREVHITYSDRLRRILLVTIQLKAEHAAAPDEDGFEQARSRPLR